MLTFRGSHTAIPAFLRPEVAAAVRAIVGPAPGREPALAAPRVAFARDRFEDRDPPVEQDEDQKPDDPADHGPDRVIDPEQHEPETAVPLALARQHRAGSAAAGTFDVQRHRHHSLPLTVPV